jgi:uncharacterized protein
MGAMPNEPSMEEILSSIKRIIAEEDRSGGRALRRAPSPSVRSARDDAMAERVDAADMGDLVLDEAVLELTQVLPEDMQTADDADGEEQRMPANAARAENKSAKAEPRLARARENGAPRSGQAGRATMPAAPAPADPVISDLSARAAREALDNLSKVLVRSDDGQSNTLEGLVCEMLRPMLKDWLDAHLPEVVETLVRREIDRITGRV